MDSVRYSNLDLLVVAQGAGAQRWQRWIRVPDTVGENAVWTYVEQHFGAPCGELESRRAGPCPLGLVFPAADAGIDDLPAEAVTVEVTPHVCFASGQRVPLVEYRCWLGSAFSSITGCPTSTAVPVESHGQLHCEHLDLLRSDPELLELQLTGWFRRMVEDGCTYLTISLGERGRYVQVMVDDRRRVIAEAVANRHLDQHQQLSPGEQAELVGLGWNRPDSGEHGNYWFHWALDAHPAFGSHPSRVTLPGAEVVPPPEVVAAGQLVAATINSVFVADVAHRAVVDVGRVQIDAH